MPPQLPTHKLGKHGPDVSALGFGMMGLSRFYGTAKPTEERLALLDHVYESGVLLWDTADMYGDSEDLIGEWFRRNPGKRENIFLATKFANFVDPVTGARSIRNEPEYVHEALEKSLRRLGTDYVDLYYVHRLDKDRPIEITIAELKKLKEAGKIKHIGLSEASADSLRRASSVVHIDALQVEYSPFSLDIESPESDLLRTARELGTAVVAYSPLNRGFLTGAIRSPDDFEDGDFRKGAPRFSKENFHKNLELVDKIKEVADKKGVTPAQITLAWLLAQGDDIIPIPGTSRVKNFDENIGALKVQLTQEEKDEIRKAVDNTEVVGTRYPENALSQLYVTTKPLDSA
ncbi:hypothetical protein SLS53_005014 [Cytospora paraplurivora]|uniref:NADP-dependent oxidoreductase domain-containing protein n=1 Tax=Cytospora paraplurivora TaxID=2898453 RepID=A0AAN9YFM3_9PEZI